MEYSKHKIQKFYNDAAINNVSKFIYGNARMDKAWETLKGCRESEPVQVLEIGCGIGEMCWRMARLWPMAQITGIDLSDVSISIARDLFGSEKVSFYQQAIHDFPVGLKYNLVILIDVYEHVPVEDRPKLHSTLRDITADDGVMFLSIPTPRHTEWLRIKRPQEIQPIDEYIFPDTLVNLGGEVNMDLILYKEISVWNKGDYAHCVLARKDYAKVDIVKLAFSRRLIAKIQHIIGNRIAKKNIKQRKILVQKKVPEISQILRKNAT